MRRGALARAPRPAVRLVRIRRPKRVTVTTIVTGQLGWSETLHVRTSVSGADDLEPRRAGGVPFRPNEIECTFGRNSHETAWTLRKVLATGPRRLKSGGLSANYGLRSWTGASLADLPDWAQYIADGAHRDANGRLPVRRVR